MGRRLCPLVELPMDGAASPAPGIIVTRHAGGVAAFRNSCPHTGVGLDWVPGRFMNREGTHLQCATHGALFRPDDGYCVAGPCAGQSLERVNVRVAGGWLELGDD